MKLNPLNDVATIELPSASSVGFVDPNARAGFDGAREMVGAPIAERKLGNAARQYFDVYAMVVPYRAVITDQKLPVSINTAKISGFQSTKSYSEYRNERFGFSVAYPTAFLLGRMPENGDGMSFHSPDGDAVISVSGSNSTGESIQEYYNEAIDSNKGSAAYTHLGNTWFVVSELHNRDVVYTKVFVGTNAINTLVITYPKGRSSSYDPIIKRVEASFRPGDLSQAW